MSLVKYLILALLLILPMNVFAGNDFSIANNTEFAAETISAPYDLRDRESYLQVTNDTGSTITIHVQIFQHDKGCDELNFNDELTANDTVVYNLDNILKANCRL